MNWGNVIEIIPVVWLIYATYFYIRTRNKLAGDLVVIVALLNFWGIVELGVRNSYTSVGPISYYAYYIFGVVLYVAAGIKTFRIYWS